MSVNNSKYFIEFLRERTLQKLPGIEAHKIMAPVVGEEFFRTFIPAENAFESAVLILLILNDKDYFDVLFTLRTNNLDSHAGQISFPGGHSEVGESDIDTAIRETYEETGIIINKSDIIGKLSKLYVQPSNSIITPIIAFSTVKPKLSINKDEVEEAFFISFDYFLDSNNLKKEYWNIKGSKILVPFWELGKKTPLWGATAMILSELIRLYNEFIYLKKN